MPLSENQYYQTLFKLSSLGRNLLTLLESQDAEITRLNQVISDGVTVDVNEIKKQIRLELTQKFDNAFTTILTNIGASTEFLAKLRVDLANSITPEVPPEDELEPPVIPSL